ncbi:MAG: DNA polymerase III subunit alpha [Ignavibacteriales bacterium]|nr:MAG: DNA polymerase III subunit alpha [Ignavibacteriales bacterium]
MFPLHMHSSYSLLEGVITIDEILSKAVEYGLKSVALTDTNGMYGLVSFYKKAMEKKIKPILGAYIDQPEADSHPEFISGSKDVKKNYKGSLSQVQHDLQSVCNDTSGSTKRIYAIFLAKNFNGYSDICRIITARKLKENFSLFEVLQDEMPDVFILTSSIELLRNIPNYKNIFAELIITKKNRLKARSLYDFAVEKKIRYVISNPVYFSEPEDCQLHKVVTAIKNRSTVDNLSDDDIVDEEFYFKHPATFSHLKDKLPEAFANMEFIAEHCNVDLGLGKHKIPSFPGTTKQSAYSLLVDETYEGLERRYGKTDESVKHRLNEELHVINELGLSDYFLVVYDIYQEAKRRKMMTLTRGSAANSLVCYCLGLTEVDPVKYDFYFTRFLNKSRSSLPDVDIDFSWKERDEIVQYIFNKYGYSKVAFISTHVTMKARSAFRETAKVYGFSDREISKLSKFIPWTDARNLPDISQRFPEARSLNFKNEPWKSIINIASRLANFPRHLSIHPGGIVISPSAITTFTALEYAKNKGVGLIITQPDMYGVEDLGLVKIDLLSQRSLGVLRDTIQQVGESSYFLSAEKHLYN